MAASSSNTLEKDLEAGPGSVFTNASVQSFSWSDITLQIKDRTTNQPLDLLTSVSGSALTGELVALMGPSGSGKTTLLNVLANRSQIPWTGSVRINDQPSNQRQIRTLSSYVEQEDALIGSLTVRETIDFAAQLALPHVSQARQRELVDHLVTSFGLTVQKDTIIGTPLRKGISGGQKRRVSVASQLVTSPKILFLDEPTSGLDSAASLEVIKFISSVAKMYNLIVVASIHQPSTSTFQLFDKLLLLSKGRTCYFGEISKVVTYFDSIVRMPYHMNPAEFLLDLVNTDFTTNSASASSRDNLEAIYKHWEGSDAKQRLTSILTSVKIAPPGTSLNVTTGDMPRSNIAAPWILLKRNFIKSYRDLLVYGTRLGMYFGLAILMGTVWLRLDYTQSSIQPFINALFFGGAFMSFMAVAYVPAIIEDLHMYNKEHSNGLYGPLSFTLANFFIGLPWLALITLVFSLITYWLSNFTNTASGFWIWVLWLFFDLLAAESLVVLVSAIFPIFVVALAIIAFANGLWMSVGGFLVPLGTLNVFWKYVFHYIDYQAYVFQAMMVNQFRQTTYECEGGHCMYSSKLEGEGKIAGTAVLDSYHISHNSSKTWEWFGIMVAIVIVYRVLAYVVLVARSRRS